MARITALATVLLLTTPALVQAQVFGNGDWTGAYLGVQSESGIELDELSDFSGFVSDYDGDLQGLFLGYRHDFGAVVVGAEIDMMQGGFDRGRVATGVFVTETDPRATVLRVGGEIGYDIGRILPYVTAGYAEIDLTYSGGTPVDGSGMFYGVGVDVALGEGFILGLEYLDHEFDDFDTAPSTTYEMQSLGVSLAFTF